MGFLSTVNINEQPPEPKRSNAGSDFRPMTFLLKEEENAKVIFLTGHEATPVIKAHSLWGLEKFPVFVPCLAPEGKECKFCKHAEGIADKNKRWGVEAQTFYIFSVLDLRPYEKDVDGVKVTVPASRKVLMMRRKQVDTYINPVYQNIRELYECDLPGTMVKVMRSKSPEKGKKSPAFGDSWQFFTFIKEEKDWKDEWKYKDSEGKLHIPTPFTEEELMRLFVTNEVEQASYLQRLAGETSTPQKDWSEED